MENNPPVAQDLNPYNINPNERLLILERKIDEIIEMNKKIHKRVDPPKWKKIIKFIFSHVLTFIALGILLYSTWQIWEIVQSVSTKVDSVKELFTQFSEVVMEKWSTISDQAEKLKFW